MPTVLYIHGADAAPDDPPRKALEAAAGPGWAWIAPSMAEDKDAEAWVGRIAGELEGMAGDSVLVGHSLGGAMLLKAVAERRPGMKLGGFVGLSVPHFGPECWDMPDFALPDGAAGALGGLGRIALWQARDDEVVAVQALDVYRRDLPGAECHLVERGGHLIEGVDMAPVARAMREMVGGV